MRRNGCPHLLLFFFFNNTAPTEIYTLPHHDALPISVAAGASACAAVSPAASSHDTVLSRLPAIVLHVGLTLSVIVMVCVYTAAMTFPQSSDTVQVLV